MYHNLIANNGILILKQVTAITYRKDVSLVKMLKEKYQKCLQRDPVLYEFLEKILLVYFNESSKPTGGGNLGDLGNLIGSLFGM